MRFYFEAFRANHTYTAILSGITLTTIFGLFAIQFSSFQNDKHPPTPLHEPIPTPHDELYSVHINSSGTGWAVGKFGTILHTRDGGSRWTQQNNGTGKPLTSVSFADEFHGFAVGGGGIILATVDGGQSWQLQDSGTKDHLLEVHALSAKHAFIAGAFGTLLSTRNGGVSWQKHSLAWNRLVPRLLLESGPVDPTSTRSVSSIIRMAGWQVSLAAPSYSRRRPYMDRETLR